MHYFAKNTPNYLHNSKKSSTFAVYLTSAIDKMFAILTVQEVKSQYILTNLFDNYETFKRKVFALFR